MTVSIRPATPADFPAIAGVMNLVWPDRPVSVESLEQDESELSASSLPLKRGLLLAEQGGLPVGLAEYGQSPGMYHPRKFHAAVNVLPSATGQGVGRALTGRLWAELAPHDPLSVIAGTQDDHPRGLDFLARQGFSEVLRYYDLWLDLPAFDFAPFLAREALPDGYRLTSYAELGGNEEAQRRIYGLWTELRADVPRPDKATPVLFEQFARRFHDPAHLHLLPAGYLLAVHQSSGELVATSELWRSDGGHLNTGLTGVQRAHRRRGLALALKLAALRYARSLGAPQIRTNTASDNAGMLGINESLGFVRQPAWVEMRWEETAGGADGRSL